MRYLIVLWLFVQCSAQSKITTYSFPSVGWTIQIPAGYIAEDSATQYGKMKRTPAYLNSLDTTEHWLLYVHDTTGWNLAKHSLNAVWRYCADSTSMKNYLARTLIEQPDVQVSTQRISGRLFMVRRFHIQRNGKKEDFVSYHNLVNGILFSTLINYYDTDSLGSKLVPIFEKSIFR